MIPRRSIADLGFDAGIVEDQHDGATTMMAVMLTCLPDKKKPLQSGGRDFSGLQLALVRGSSIRVTGGCRETQKTFDHSASQRAPVIAHVFRAGCALDFFQLPRT